MSYFNLEAATFNDGSYLASVNSYNSMMDVFKSMESRFQGVFFVIHVDFEDPDAEHIPPISVFPKKYESPDMNGPLEDPSSFAQRFEKYKKAKEVYRKVVKRVHKEVAKLADEFKERKCHIRVEKKNLNRATNEVQK